jgi:hypothetical protein
VALPYTPLAAILGFTPLPAGLLVALAALTALYLVAAELAKPWCQGSTAGLRRPCPADAEGCPGEGGQGGRIVR